jgi:methyl-accepting chemotaxis protein
MTLYFLKEGGTILMLSTIRGRMLSYVLLPVALCFTLVFAITLYQTRGLMNESVKENLIGNAKIHGADVENWLKNKEPTLNSIAAIVAARKPSDMEAQNLLERMNDTGDGIIRILLSYPDKHFLIAAKDRQLLPADFDPTTRLWWKKAVERDEVGYTDAYLSALGNQPVVAMSRAVKVNGQVVAVVSADISITELTALIAKNATGDDSYGFLIDGKGRIISHPKQEFLTDITKTMPAGIELLNKDVPFIAAKSPDGKDKLYAKYHLDGTDWYYVSSIPVSEAYAKVNHAILVAIGIGVAGLLIIAILLLRFSNSISKPLIRVSAVAGRVAEGDLAVDMDSLGIYSKDEIGSLVDSVKKMIVNLRSLVGNVAQAAEKVAASSEELTANSEQVAQASVQIAATVSDMAVETEKQSSSADEVICTFSGVSQEVGMVVQNVKDMTLSSEQTNVATEEGKVAVGKSVQQMQNIEHSVSQLSVAIEKLDNHSDKIGEIVGVISGIAGQTNLLALNAAIEAARAGEAGRGFAVVAEEVRKLAEDSDNAAKQISLLISEIQEETRQAVATMATGSENVKQGTLIVNKAGDSFVEIHRLMETVVQQSGSINASIAKVAEGSEQASVAAKEIANVCEQTTNSAKEVSAATQEQTSSIEQITYASQELAKMAEELRHVIGKFTL